MSHYDYGKTLMLKIGIGSPDNKGGCNLVNTFEQVLEKIKIIDRITAGAPKIIYLVGWQYNGHDDRYPAFFEVNEHAKRAGETARESLLWLIEEAKKYHTTISLHINLTDAYAESELWQEYLENGLIILDRKGKPKPAGTWNGRNAYWVCYKNEFAAGYFIKRVDRLFDLLPLTDMGTIHADAFFISRGKGTSIKEEKAARRKMIGYFNARGVDLTSEFIYREMKCGYRSLWGKSDIIGLIPAFWHLKLTQSEYLKYPAAVIAGGRLNKDLQRDYNLKYLFYGNMHGEDVCGGEDWWKRFLYDFATESLPYFYLNHQSVQKITGIFDGRAAWFTNDVKTYIKDKKITQNGQVLKQNDTLMLPVHWRENTFFAYSKNKTEISFPFDSDKAITARITPDGLTGSSEMIVEHKTIKLKFDDDCAFLITAE